MLKSQNYSKTFSSHEYKHVIGPKHTEKLTEC